jgi:hypothetical protein
MTEPAKRGPKPKPVGEKFKSPVRGLRIPVAELEIIDAAVKQVGGSFSAWARPILVAAAKKIVK